MARGFPKTARERAAFEGAGTGYIPSRESEREGDRSYRSGASAARAPKSVGVLDVLKEDGVEKNVLGLTNDDFKTLSADQRNVMSMAIKTAIAGLKREMAGPDGKGLEGKELMDIITSEGDDKQSMEDLRDGIRDIVEQQYSKAMEKQMTRVEKIAWKIVNQNTEFSSAETNKSLTKEFMAPVSKKFAREEYVTAVEKAKEFEDTRLLNRLEKLNPSQRLELGGLLSRTREAIMSHNPPDSDYVDFSTIDEDVTLSYLSNYEKK